jgi:hypothetical protein
MADRICDDELMAEAHVVRDALVEAGGHDHLVAKLNAVMTLHGLDAGRRLTLSHRIAQAKEALKK